MALSLGGTHPDLLCCVLLRLLSRESPSGAMKAVLRKAASVGPGEEKQFLEVCLQGTRWRATGAQPTRKALSGGSQPDAQMSSGLGEEPEAQELQLVGAGETWSCVRGW